MSQSAIQGAQRTLVLGGARSGKSKFAESLVADKVSQSVKDLSTQASQLTAHYVATGLAFDDEMKQRIAHHQHQRRQLSKSRDFTWQEHECPLRLASLLQTLTSNDVVLIECLTLWLNNLIYELGEQASDHDIELAVSELIKAIQTSSAQLIFVSNEVGLGIVPLGKVSRLFVDNAGRMNQALAENCDAVTFIAAGLPLSLKSP